MRMGYVSEKRAPCRGLGYAKALGQMELDLFEELRRQPSVGAEYDEEESGVRYGWSGK